MKQWSSVFLVLVTVLAVGCQPDASSRLETVERQPDLDKLDLPVREQFDAFHSRLEQAAAQDPVDRAALAGAYGDIAMLYHAYEYWEPSAAAYRNAQQLQPHNPDWPYYLGLVAITLGEVALAESSFKRVLELRPADDLALARLGETYLESGRLEAAREQFDRSLAINPRNFRALLGEGRRALELSDYDAAADYLKRAGAIDASSTQVNHALGLAYRGAGQMDQAREHFEMAQSSHGLEHASVTNDPRFNAITELRKGSVTHDFKALQALVEGRMDDAIREMRLAIEADPNNLDNRRNLGLLLIRSEQHEAGIRELNQILLRDPQHVETLKLLAENAAMAGALDEARSRLDQALEADPEDGEVWLMIGNLDSHLGDDEHALEAYRAARKYSPTLAMGYVGIALSLMRLERHEEALEIARVGMEAAPDNRALRVIAARVMAGSPDERLHDPDTALSLMRQSVRGGLALNEAETIAMAFARQGRFDQAVSWQQAALAGAVATNPARPQIEARLQYYRNGQNPPVPWTTRDNLDLIPIRPPGGG